MQSSVGGKRAAPLLRGVQQTVELAPFLLLEAFLEHQGAISPFSTASA